MSQRRTVRAEVHFDRVRADLEVREEFPAEVLAAAQAAAAKPALPEDDETALELVTLDPVGSRDLDQAVHLARAEDGYLVSYAIADVAAFVDAGGPIDEEAWARALTLYCPDKRIPLHPERLCEDAASLLSDQTRPAALWQMRLDADARLVETTVRRALVRSRAQLDYPQTQQDFDAGRAHESIALLQEIGQKRIALAQQRHSINLNLPEQVVEKSDDGRWTLRYRSQLPCELWNAEISLLTGMAAGQMMVQAGVGILRTLPPPEPEALKQLKQTADAMGIAWQDGEPPSAVLDRLDRAVARNVAFIEQAAALLRGADYYGFTDEHPKDAQHSAIGAAYAHVTAPLRRLVDRYGTEVCLAVSAGTAVPQWAIDRIGELPEAMAAGVSKERRLEGTIIDTVEALLLQPHIGADFPAVVVGTGEKQSTVVLDEPAVRARANGATPQLGERVSVTVVDAVPEKHRITLSLSAGR